MELIAKHKEKQLDEIKITTIYHHTVFEREGNSLTLGVDYLTNHINTHTLALGMTFNF